MQKNVITYNIIRSKCGSSFFYVGFRFIQGSARTGFTDVY